MVCLYFFRRGRKGGVKARNKRRRYKPVLPKMILGNVQSIQNKCDELHARIRHEEDFRTTSLFCFSETWLKGKISDSMVDMDGFKLMRNDRDIKVVNKKKGGGVCVYVNNKWCHENNASIKKTFCSSDIEFLAVNCRPYYVPREFSHVVVIVVYIPPDANDNNAKDILSKYISELDAEAPDAARIITGDFNHCIPTSKDFPGYYQHVKCKTRGNKTIDLCFTNVRDAYISSTLPKLGKSDHNLVKLAPKYRPIVQREPPTTRVVKQWTPDAIENLKAEFESTDWNMFIESASNDTDELIDVTTNYMHFCVEKSIPQKTVKVYSNSKPWINNGISKLLFEKKNAFFTKDKNQIKLVQKKLDKAIQKGKEDYKKKLEDSFEGNNMKKVWDNMKLMSGYTKKNQKKNVQPNPDNSLEKANELNAFYTRFDREDFSEQHAQITTDFNNTSSSYVNFETSEDEVRVLLKACNPKKAPGPDGISPKLLKTCADQLAFIFKTIFNACFEQEYVPECWKMSCIIPVPKKPIVKVLNDLRPVALTSAIMKICEKIVLNRLKLYTRRYLDPLQFAYQSRRNTEDAILFMLNNVYKHIDKPGNTVRIMFYDFSSAFNTIQPHLLVQKMKQMNIPLSFIKWIFSYITNRPQFVRLAVQKDKGTNLRNTRENNYVNSSIIKTNTGAPQGTVLSPFLFTIYTADGQIPDCPLCKFADDTSQVGLINNDNDFLYKKGITDFVAWCKNNFLELNVGKTKEMIIDFRRANRKEPEKNCH